ncbi:uncharacterized protein [Clytia hemisphaerica]|uniref:Uncharacterized protein n=2 Tax=Clytia hemisphaerica TaxID=252671 RepID=A0A7M5WYF1_9CNID|eukprot:TCONS_00021049-protein
MLVHKFKSKKPTAYSQSKLNPFFNQDELGELTHTHDTLEDDRYVDEKYRDFHRRRQSEKVLNVIRSVLGDNNESLHKLTAAQNVNETSRSVLNSSKKESPNVPDEDSLTGFITPKKESPQTNSDTDSIATLAAGFSKKVSTKEDAQPYGKQFEATGTTKDSTIESSPQLNGDEKDNLQKIQQENFNLKSHLCLVYDYLKTIEESRPNIGENQQTQGLGTRADSFLPKTSCGSCDKLRQLVTSLKIDCLQERTEKEMLRFKILELNNYYRGTLENYEALAKKVEDMEMSCNKRLNKAEDNMHRIQCTKKKSFFRRKK